MTVWSTFRDTVIRSLLKDTAVTTKNWTDAELLMYANWGIRDLALVVPAIHSLSLTGSGPEYVLPVDFANLQNLTLLENNQTYFVQPLMPQPGMTWNFTTPTDSSSPFGYLLDWPELGSLTVTRTKATNSYVLRYLAYPAELTDNDTELPYARQPWAEQALACYICYCAHLREGVGRAALAQWSQRPDLPVGNPQNMEAAEWLKAYNRLISLHKERG